MSDLTALLAGIRLLSLDLDGVLTDGGLYYTEAGDVMRKYDVKDGMGMELLMQSGVPISVITASNTPAIATRLAKLHVPHVHMGVKDKLPQLREICDSLGIGLHQVMHVADDVNDLSVLRNVGLPVAVADALPAVKAVARHVTTKVGGRGAVRELCDLLIAARG